MGRRKLSRRQLWMRLGVWMLLVVAQFSLAAGEVGWGWAMLLIGGAFGSVGLFFGS